QSRLYVARDGETFAGALLNLYYRDWVEYFTPIAVEDFRKEQVLSALIAVAMTDAILEGRKYWNWGGTWPSQSGVYHFKRGWGAQERIYQYFGAVRSGSLASITMTAFSEEYPHYYLRPFLADRRGHDDKLNPVRDTLHSDFRKRPDHVQRV